MDTIAQRLRYAARDGQKQEVNDLADKLLAADEDLNGVDSHGGTAMMLAAWNGRGNVVQLLIDNGADIHMTDNVGETAIMLAAEKGHGDVVLLLIDNGADIHKKNCDGCTALMYAALNGHNFVVYLLIGKGAQINVKARNGSTAIMYAAWRGHGDIVQLLWDHGADLNICNKNGKCAKDFAKAEGHDAVYEIIRNKKKKKKYGVRLSLSKYTVNDKPQSQQQPAQKSLQKEQEKAEAARAVAEKQRLAYEEALQREKKKEEEARVKAEAEAAAALAEVKRLELIADQEQRQKKQKEEEEARAKAEAEKDIFGLFGDAHTKSVDNNAGVNDIFGSVNDANKATTGSMDWFGSSFGDNSKSSDDFGAFGGANTKSVDSNAGVNDIFGSVDDANKATTSSMDGFGSSFGDNSKSSDDFGLFGDANTKSVDSIAGVNDIFGSVDDTNKATTGSMDGFDTNTHSAGNSCSTGDSHACSRVLALKTEYETTLASMSSDLLRVKEVQEEFSSHQHDVSTVQHLQAQVDAIDSKYKSSPLDRAEMAHIAATPELKQYYELVQKVFNEAFLVTAAISTGMIEVQQQSAGRVFSILSTLTQGIPFVAGVLSFIEGRVDSLLAARQDGRYGFLSNLNPTSNAFDAALYAERVARHVTITLEDSIKTTKEKKNPSEFKAIKKFMKMLEDKVNKVDKGLAAGLFGKESALELLAYKHAKAGLEFVMSGHLEDAKPQEGLRELVAHMAGCEMTRLPLSAPTTQPDTSLSTSAIRVTVTAAHDQQSQQPRDVSGSVHWIAEALQAANEVTDDEVHLFDSILARNNISSRRNLAGLTEDRFQRFIVDKHSAELNTIGLIMKIEALYAVCRGDAATTTATGPAKVACTEHVTSEQHDVLKQQIAVMKQQLEDSRNMDPSDVASARLVKRLQQELADTKRTMNAVFQSSFVDDGSRLQEVVATREGATVRVVNSQADEQFQALQGALMQLQEEVEAMQRDKEAESSASRKKQK